MNHRTTAGLLTTTALTLTLTACGGGDSKADAKPAATTASPVPTVPLRDRFLQEINAANIESWAHGTGPSDDELSSYPDRWCSALASGHSVDWIFDDNGGNLYPIGDTWGTEIHDAYQVLVLAVKDYCPKYTDQVTAEARASGNY